MKPLNLTTLPHYGDILAIPFFLLLAIYFYQLEDRTMMETILLLFSITGVIVDVFFTYMFLFFNKTG